MKWVDPAALFRAIKSGECDERTLMQELEELQRKAARAINPVADEGPYNPPLIPTTKSFTDLNIPGNGTVILLKDSTIIYENFYCEILNESLGAFDVSPNIEVWANNNFVGYCHSNVSFMVPGASNWELKNNSGVARRVTCYVRSSIIQHSGGMVPSVMMGQTLNSDTSFRPARISPNSERLYVSFGNVAADVNAGNGELWINSQETTEKRGNLSGKGNPVNSNVVAAQANTSLVVMALGLMEYDHAANLGDMIVADWHFTGGTLFARQQINTGMIGVNAILNPSIITFGATGPKSGVGASLQVDVVHTSGAAPGDGWFVWALCRYVQGY